MKYGACPRFAGADPVFPSNSTGRGGLASATQLPTYHFSLYLGGIGVNLTPG